MCNCEDTILFSGDFELFEDIAAPYAGSVEGIGIMRLF
jgi:hypothetical protein